MQRTPHNRMSRPAAAALLVILAGTSSAPAFDYFRAANDKPWDPGTAITLYVENENVGANGDGIPVGTKYWDHYKAAIVASFGAWETELGRSPKTTFAAGTKGLDYKTAAADIQFFPSGGAPTPPAGQPYLALYFDDNLDSWGYAPTRNKVILGPRIVQGGPNLANATAMQNIATHEFGHAIGLAHFDTDESAPENVIPMMEGDSMDYAGLKARVYPLAGSFADTGDDRAGVRTAYGAGTHTSTLLRRGTVKSYNFRVENAPTSEKDIWRLTVGTGARTVVGGVASPANWSGNFVDGGDADEPKIVQFWSNPAVTDIKPLDTLGGFKFKLDAAATNADLALRYTTDEDFFGYGGKIGDTLPMFHERWAMSLPGPATGTGPIDFAVETRDGKLTMHYMVGEGETTQHVMEAIASLDQIVNHDHYQFRALEHPTTGTWQVVLFSDLPTEDIKPTLKTNGLFNGITKGGGRETTIEVGKRGGGGGASPLTDLSLVSFDVWRGLDEDSPIFSTELFVPDDMPPEEWAMELGMQLDMYGGFLGFTTEYFAGSPLLNIYDTMFGESELGFTLQLAGGASHWLDLGVVPAPGTAMLLLISGSLMTPRRRISA
ncbi:MAG: hypothetical protein KAS72_02280 [Phycisphaerales bacterium]|nr:hypothetical protein [Phycisphaerales bacterium]